MKFHLALIPAAVLTLAACGDGTPRADPESVPQAAGEPAPLPSTDLGNTYPSQIGRQSTTTPGAEGGRSSATTGESPDGQAPDPSAQQRTTPP